MLIDPATLMIIQRERFRKLEREAALQRLLQTVKNVEATAAANDGRAVANGRGRTSVVATVKQLLVTGLQTRLRAALSR